MTSLPFLAFAASNMALGSSEEVKTWLIFIFSLYQCLFCSWQLNNNWSFVRSFVIYLISINKIYVASLILFQHVLMKQWGFDMGFSFDSNNVTFCILHAKKILNNVCTFILYMHTHFLYFYLFSIYFYFRNLTIYQEK